MCKRITKVEVLIKTANPNKIYRKLKKKALKIKKLISNKIELDLSSSKKNLNISTLELDNKLTVDTSMNEENKASKYLCYDFLINFICILLYFHISILFRKIFHKTSRYFNNKI